MELLERIAPNIDFLLEPGEDVRWVVWSNRSTRFRAAGGRVFVTNRRMLFRPHLLEIPGKSSWSCRISDVISLGVAPRGASPLNGSFRRRLRVSTAQTTEFFVVGDATEVLRQLRRLTGING